MEKNSLLRQLPKVDEVLRRPPVAALELPQTVVTDLVRGRIEELRQRILEGSLTSLPTVEELEDADDETVDAAYAAIQEVYDALDELSTEELDQITGLDKLAALMVYFVKCFSQKSERNIPNFRNGIFPYISRKHFHMIMVQSVA